MNDRERRVLDFACLTFRHAAVRAAEIKRRFGWSAERYHQELNTLIDRPEAQEYAWATCRRYLRIRHESRRQETSTADC